MPVPENEVRLWIPGVPKSAQNRRSFEEYFERIRAEARKHFAEPVTTDVTILFGERKTRPDVDNVVKKIIDALKGVAFVDDRHVRLNKSGVIDRLILAMAGDGHSTFAKVQRGDEFLIIINVDPPTPSILFEVESS